MLLLDVQVAPDFSIPDGVEYCHGHSCHSDLRIRLLQNTLGGYAFEKHSGTATGVKCHSKDVDGC